MRRMLVLIPLLAACAGPGAGLTRFEREQLADREHALARATQRVHDSNTLERIANLLARMASGVKLRLYVLDHPAPQAELIGGEVLLVRTGLLDAAHTDDALAFVLAHELAHAALGHIAARRQPGWDSTAAEIAADAWAQQRVAGIGLDPRAGPALLARLLPELPDAAQPLLLRRLDALGVPVK
jgi:predicted Zn-dependent protease